jgi:hypothetical protein
VVLGMLSSAGLLLAQAPPAEQARLRDELLELFEQFLGGLALDPAARGSNA